jgi:hypothetical protein
MNHPRRSIYLPAPALLYSAGFVNRRFELTYTDLQFYGIELGEGPCDRR